MKLNRPKYSFSFENPETKEMLSLADEKKYGFYTAPKPNCQNEVNLDGKLPQIGEFKPYER